MRDKHTFTIHTELIEGTLSGARNIYMGANSTCHLYVIPRTEISLANNIADIAGQPAFYILIGDTNGLKSEAYIGQTTDFANRKNDHIQKKDFWSVALVFVSDNHKIYGDDVKYLEYLGIELAQSVDSFSLLNGANPRKPNIAPYRVNDMEVFFRDIQLLTRFYGCGIFDAPVAKPHPEHLFYVHATDRPAEGIGYYDECSKQFVLVKGSVIASEVVSSFKATAARQKFIKEHCKTDKGRIVLQHNVPMDSPSGASGIILGRPSNGWDDWKDSDGNKLGSVVKR
ncbi:MAG: GIY-YIG nuclease family protein [Bacteroidales bacterium]|nr:GIY-YIG nuclease family protein [Candidatus Colimorpha merdihippi]